MDAIFQPLYDFFGFIVKFLLDNLKDYGVAIILFTVLLRAALIPLGVNQFKNTIKQQGMNEDLKDLKRRYGNDKEKLQHAQMELYQKHGFNPLSGCLPSIIQLVIIWPVYRIISAPLVHVMGVTKVHIGNATSGIAQILLNAGLINASQAAQAQTFNLPLINALKMHTDAAVAALNQVYTQGLMKADQLLNLHSFGLDLGIVPTYDTGKLFGADMGTYLPLLIIPILAVVTTFLSMKVTQSMLPNAKKKTDAEAGSKNNPAKKGQDTPDPSAGMMKGMQYFMPLFTLIISFTTPAALGVYWIINNIMSIVQQYVLSHIVTKKAPAAVVVKANDAGSAPTSKR